MGCVGVCECAGVGEVVMVWRCVRVGEGGRLRVRVRERGGVGGSDRGSARR